MLKETLTTQRTCTSFCLRILAFLGVFYTLFNCSSKCVFAKGTCTWPAVMRGAVDETNVRVTIIQYLLRSHGYHIYIDGRYGSRTEHLVKLYQKAQRIKDTGIVDAPTWSKLIVALKPGSHGAAVYAAQVPLKEMIDEQLLLNGRFDDRTKHAVQAFQHKYGLKVSGNVSTDTWQYLVTNIYD